MVDFYFGVVTREASQEDVDKLNGFLLGERRPDGSFVATDSFASQLDEFESFMNRNAQEKTAE